MSSLKQEVQAQLIGMECIWVSHWLLELPLGHPSSVAISKQNWRQETVLGLQRPQAFNAMMNAFLIGNFFYFNGTCPGTQAVVHMALHYTSSSWRAQTLCTSVHLDAVGMKTVGKAEILQLCVLLSLSAHQIKRVPITIAPLQLVNAAQIAICKILTM